MKPDYTKGILKASIALINAELKKNTGSVDFSFGDLKKKDSITEKEICFLCHYYSDKGYETEYSVCVKKTFCKGRGIFEVVGFNFISHPVENLFFSHFQSPYLNSFHFFARPLDRVICQ